MIHKYVFVFLQDGKDLVTGCNDKFIRLYSLEEGRSDPVMFQGHTDYIKCVVWTSDPNLFVSSEDSSKIR